MKNYLQCLHRRVGLTQQDGFSINELHVSREIGFALQEVATRLGKPEKEQYTMLGYPIVIKHYLERAEMGIQINYKEAYSFIHRDMFVKDEMYNIVQISFKTQAWLMTEFPFPLLLPKLFTERKNNQCVSVFESNIPFGQIKLTDPVKDIHRTIQLFQK